ncbi:glucosyltransferase domain-containing protein [Pseudomonas chlororaphis]|nr:glucosyltransferase domain-containing protein [Pseudomonas chlororaphis]
MDEIINRELTPGQVLVFFGVAVVVFIYPLLMADYCYIDDVWRSQSAGTAWIGGGRILIEWLYQGLSFTRGAPNIFPLPLFISAVVMSFSLRAWVFHFFGRPTVVGCFVALPLWYSPFFLQNLSYQYDGPGMALGMAVIVFSMAFHHRSIGMRVMVSGMLITVALSFYQMTIDVFIGLSCVELIRCANEQRGGRAGVLLLGEKITQLFVGVIIYWLTSYQLMTDERKELRHLEPGWGGRLIADLRVVAGKVALLCNEGNAWMCWGLFLLASAGFCVVVFRILKGADGITGKMAMILLCACAVFISLLAIPGLALVFDFFNGGVRLLLGFSVVLVLMLYLSYHALNVIHPRLVLGVMIPVVAMLSFSYAYGRVLSLQKELHGSVMQSLAYDITSDVELKTVDKFYMIIRDVWVRVPGADGSMKLMPALKSVLNVDFILLSEMMPRVGVMNISTVEGYEFDVVAHDRELQLVRDNKFYRIYVSGREGFVVMKGVSVDDVYE